MEEKDRDLQKDIGPSGREPCILCAWLLQFVSQALSGNIGW